MFLLFLPINMNSKDTNLQQSLHLIILPGKPTSSPTVIQATVEPAVLPLPQDKNPSAHRTGHLHPIIATSPSREQHPEELRLLSFQGHDTHSSSHGSSPRKTACAPNHTVRCPSPIASGSVSASTTYRGIRHNRLVDDGKHDIDMGAFRFYTSQNYLNAD